MEYEMRNIDWRLSKIPKLLLKLEESVLDLIFDVFRKFFLRADQFRVLWMATLLHYATSLAVERLLELVDAAIGHW